MDIKSGFDSVLKLDKRWSGIIRLKNLPAPIRKTSELLAHSGDSLGWWVALVLLWIFGDIFWRQWALTIALGIAFLAVVLLPLRRLVGRSRPMGFWEKKTRKKSPDSFPSGHAARTFLLAILATGLGPAWLAALFWIWAPLVSLSRVALGLHFLSDVIGGLLVAMTVGLLWLHFHEAVLELLVSFSLRFLHIPLW